MGSDVCEGDSDRMWCDLCRGEEIELRPVCVAGRDEIPLMCSDCTIALEAAGRIDRERDADVFGYSKEAIQERMA